VVAYRKAGDKVSIFCDCFVLALFELSFWIGLHRLNYWYRLNWGIPNGLKHRIKADVNITTIHQPPNDEKKTNRRKDLPQVMTDPNRKDLDQPHQSLAITSAIKTCFNANLQILSAVGFKFGFHFLSGFFLTRVFQATFTNKNWGTLRLEKFDQGLPNQRIEPWAVLPRSH